MSEVRRKKVALTAEPHNEDTFVASVKKNMKKRGAYSEEFADTDLQKEILEVPGDTVWVWNKSKGEFHVPPVSFKPQDIEMSDIIIFQVNEVKPFEKAEVTTRQFKKCLLDGKLQLVSEADARKIKSEGEKELKKKSKGGNKGGLAPSGLPNSLSSALAYIMQCEDINELEGFVESGEERESILAVIEERIDEIENSEGSFQD